jgi:hypothetical protein
MVWRISPKKLIRSAISLHWCFWRQKSECVDVFDCFFNQLLCVTMLAVNEMKSVENHACQSPWTEQHVLISTGGSVDWIAWRDLHWMIRGLNRMSWFALEDPWTEQHVVICIGGSVDWTEYPDLHWRIRGLNSIQHTLASKPLYWTATIWTINIPSTKTQYFSYYNEYNMFRPSWPSSDIIFTQYLQEG